MSDQEPTELMILMKVVELVGRKMLQNEQDSNNPITTGYIANVVNNFIASSPNLAFAGSTGSLSIGDKYLTGQAGAVGPNAYAQETSFVQIWSQVESQIDLPSLAQQLAQLRAEMKRVAKDDLEQDLLVAEVAHAEVSANSSDGAAVMRHLARAGLWALDVAKSIGVEIASSAIKAAMGLPQ